MNNRLQRFLQAENITQSQFADSIGVARASISHIISGRNKPGYDFIESMVRTYPALNIEWLLTGEGKMYKQSADDDLFASVSQPAVAPAVHTAAPVSTHTAQFEAPSAPVPAPNGRTISRIVVFYSDNTYQELH